MSLTKTQIERYKSGNLAGIYNALKPNHSVRDLITVLQNLGHLPDDFDGAVLLSLLDHPSSDMRYWSVKKLAKLTHHRICDGVSQKDG